MIVSVDDREMLHGALLLEIQRRTERLNSVIFGTRGCLEGYVKDGPVSTAHELIDRLDRHSIKLDAAKSSLQDAIVLHNRILEEEIA